ncbi:MAG TPA: hypothetical protein DEG17_24105 [Cyanobacteria bacterium UBA11149]|nr:hypothetical protein [Cyanobacteria bacterium UBA11367]HBE60636.1 hypothetical protein [Cyanobacteria bacterium UBA11366]HBK63985.1 hypothetical protein [Cyanobacteria bacterium UBA11166]HBR73914.1 hypothetical protein [Cyanobacteria bacterium UBA11159]HBS72472.1 hypothetical protein [Cyanobacteria bacterium UBA11153]HBW91865.1 hypothetical protein [Cyanobacteria bacterium UBA11149]HCA96863.1 hypothetical protein [Cyanobacteria bacterium UBA9226]
MFKINKLFDLQNPYREVLHTLLYSYPNGLSAREISDKLGISETECDRLLKIEQIRDAVDADPFTGTLIFKSKRTNQPKYSIEEALKMAHRYKILLGIEIGAAILSASLISFTLISIPLNISLSFGTPSRQIQPSKSWGNSQHTEDLIKARVEAELAAQKRQGLENEKNDLNKRITHLEALVDKAQCSKYWIKNETCYMEGRLLNQAEFEKEIAQMKLEVSKINEILSF